MANEDWWKAQGTPVAQGEDWWSSAGTPDAPTQATPATPAIARPETGDFMRGFQRTLPELKQLAGGTMAAIGDVTGWDGLRDKGLDIYKAQEAELAPLSKPTDSASEAWKRVKQGNLGAGVDFLQNAAGYTAGQALESLAAAGTGAAIGAIATPEVGGLGAVPFAIGGFVAKQAVKRAVKGQAEKIVAEQMAKGVAKTEAKKQAAEYVAANTAKDVVAKQVAGKYTEAQLRKMGGKAAGAALGAQGMNTVMELGSVYPEAYQKAQDEGREMTAWEQNKAIGASLAAAGLESATDMFNLGILFRGAKGAARDTAERDLRQAVKEYGKRAAVAGTEGALREAGTEAAQTGLERFGAGQSLNDPDAWRDYIDSAAVGAVGGVLFGGAAALRQEKEAGPASFGKDPLDSARADYAEAKASGDPSATRQAQQKLADELAQTGRAQPRTDSGTTADATEMPNSSQPAIDDAAFAQPDPAQMAANMRMQAQVQRANAKTVLGRAAADATDMQADAVAAVPFDMSGMGATHNNEAPVDGFTRLGAIAQGLNLDPEAIVAAARADVGDDPRYSLDGLDDRILTTYAQSLASTVQPAQAQDGFTSEGAVGFQPTPVQAPSVEAQSGQANPVEGGGLAGESPVAAGDEPALASVPAAGAQAQEVSTASNASPQKVADPRAIAAPEQSGYDESQDILDSDITTPSGTPFTIRDAADRAAARHEGGRVFPVDGGFVVRVPSPQASSSGRIEAPQPVPESREQGALAGQAQAAPAPTALPVQEDRAQDAQAVPGSGLAAAQAADSFPSPQATPAPDSTQARQAAREANVPADLLAKRDAATERLNAASAAMQQFPTGNMGLTPDAVKATPEWKAAKIELDRAAVAARNANAAVVKASKVAKPNASQEGNNPEFLHNGWATRNASLGERYAAAKKALDAAEKPLREARYADNNRLPPGYKTIPYPERGMPEGVALQDDEGNDIAYPLTPSEAADRAWKESGRTDRFTNADAREQASAAQLAALRAEVKAAQDAWDANGKSPMGPTREAERLARVGAEQKARDAAAKAARTRAENKAKKPRPAMTSKELREAEKAKSEQPASNQYVKYDEAAKAYGRSVREDGAILKDGKESGLFVREKGKRLRIEDKAGKLTFSGAPNGEALGKFMESFWFAEKVKAKPEQPAPSQQTEPVAQKAGVKPDDSTPSQKQAAPDKKEPFDSEKFYSDRAAVVKASREAGNVHLDQVDASVEAMRAYTIFDVHNPADRGVIDTVDNHGNVYVLWDDGRRSFLGPSDLKDYAMAQVPRLDSKGLNALRKRYEKASAAANAASRKQEQERVSRAVGRIEAEVREAKPLLDMAMSGSKAQREAAQEYLDGDIDLAEFKAAMDSKPAAHAASGKLDNTGSAAEHAGTLAAQDALFDRARNGELSLAEYKAGWQALQENKAAILSELEGMKKDDLLKYAGARYKNDRKPELVRAAMLGLQSNYSIGRGITWGMGTDLTAAYAAQVESTTEADLKAFSDKAAEARKARDQRMAGVQDPKTLEDFINAARLLGSESKLTAEQRATFDRLRADARKEQRDAEAKRNAVVRQVDTGGTGMELVETKHTQKGHDLFVVRTAERVDPDTYKALNAAAKRLGGYYSSFRGNGAIPGFTFTSRENAESFMAVRDGNVDASGQQHARAEAKAESRAESLAEKAERLKEKAEDSLGRERKENTRRQAAQAAHAEAEARQQLALANTMSKLAEAIEEGRARMLAFVRHKSQVEMFEAAVKAAHWDYLRAQGVNWEKAKEMPLSADSLTDAKLPGFHLSRGDAAVVARRLIRTRGGKAFGESIAKLVNYGDEYREAVGKNPHKFALVKRTADGSNPSLSFFSRKRDAEAAVARSSDSHNLTVVKMPGAGKTSRVSEDWLVTVSPEVAIERKLWAPDFDKKITLNIATARKIIELLGVTERGDQQVPYWWIDHLKKRDTLAKLGIETNYEYREALREYLALREAPSGEDTIRKLERALVGNKAVGVDFFPTPPAVIQRLMEQADIQPGMRVLEPSAGKGDIAEAIRDAAENVAVDAVEMSSVLREILEAKGFEIIGEDFLAMPAEPIYDRIVMNPPFLSDNGAAHVQHAYSMLKPGGRLVAVMGNGQRGAEAFDGWLEKVGGLSEPLPDGSFRSSFRPTGVATKIVEIERGDSGLENVEDSATDWLANIEADESRTNGDIDADRLGLRKAVNGLLGKSGLRVEYLRGYAGLPEGLRNAVESRNAMGRKGQTAALYDPETKRVFVFTHVVRTPERAAWNAAHEIAGHDGLRKLLGKRLDDVLELAAKNPTVAALADEIAVQRKLTPAQRLLAVEEALAELAAAVRTGDYGRIQEKYRIEVPEGIRARVAQAVANFIRRLKELLQNRTGVVFKDADVRALLENAWQAAQSDSAIGTPSSALESSEDQTQSEAFRRWFGSSGPLAVLPSQAAMLEGRPDGNASNSKSAPDLLESQAFRLQGLSGLDVPAQREVLDGVLALGQDRKVLNSVVELIPVEVVNVLRDKKLSPEMLFHNEAVLKDILSADANGSVATAIDVADALVGAVARVATEGSAIATNPLARPSERDTASGADNRDHLHTASINQTANNGNFDPDNDSILESVESVGDALASAGNSIRNVKLPAGYLLADLFGSQDGVKSLHWWDTTVGTPFNLAKKSPLFRRVFDSVQNMVADTSHYANAAMDLAPNILPKFDSIKDIFKKRPMSAADAKKVSDAVFQGTKDYTRDVNGEAVKTSDVSKAGIVWTPDELRTMFGMTGKLQGNGKYDGQIGLYEQARAAIDRSLDDTAVTQMIRHAGDDGNAVRDEMLAAGNAQAAANILSRHLVDQIKLMQGDTRSNSLQETADQVQEIAKQIDKLKAKGYAPLSRFGRYTVYRDGDNPLFLMFETQREANRAARMLREKADGNGIKTGVMSQKQYQMFKGMTPETLELFGEILGLDKTGNEQDDLVFQTFLKAAKSNRSALKRLIHRQGIEGYSQDLPRVLAAFLYSNARLAATNLHAPETQRAINDIPKEQGALKDAAHDLNDYITNPDDAGAFLSGFNFAQYLGGSIASAMVNMTQPLTMSFPWLSQYGGAWKAAKALGDAMKLVGKGGDTGNAMLDEALKRADADGHTQPQEVHQLQAIASGRGALRVGDGTKAGDAMATAMNKYSSLVHLWGIPFSLAEQFNRRSTFIAAFNMATEQGMSDPYGFAVNAVQTTQGIYNKANRPAWSRNAIGGMAFTFKTYSINYVEMLHRMWNTGKPGSQERKAARKGVLLAAATMFLLAGAGGLPGADDLDDIIDGLMQRLGYNFSSKQEREKFFANLIGEQGASFMEHGLSAVPGMPIDVSGRLGMGNLIPSTGLFVRKADHSQDIAEIAGPTGDFIKRSGEALGQLVEGNLGASMLAIAPRAAANAWKGIEMASTGEYRDTRGRKVLETTGLEAASKFIGFQPASVAKVQQASGAAMDLLSNYRIVSASIADRWAKGIHEQDPGEVLLAQKELADWNAKNPDMPIRIGRNALRSRVRNLAMDRRERLSKATPKAVRAQVETMFDARTGRNRSPVDGTE